MKLDEETLVKILDFPIVGLRTISNQQPSTEFMMDASKVKGTSMAGVIKKFLKSEFQIVFEFVNKVVLPKSEKRTIVSVVDLFMIKCLSKFELISLPTLMIEHMYKVIYV